MDFSISLLGVFFLILHDICLASVFVTYKDPKEVKAVYAERKSNGNLLHFKITPANSTQNSFLMSVQLHFFVSILFQFKFQIKNSQFEMRRSLQEKG